MAKVASNLRDLKLSVGDIRKIFKLSDKTKFARHTSDTLETDIIFTTQVLDEEEVEL